MSAHLATPALLAALGATAADLEANRRGALSHAQRAALRAEVPRMRRRMIVAGVLAVLLLAATVATPLFVHWKISILPGMFALLAALISYGGRLGATEERHLGSGDVRQQHGRLVASALRSRGGTTHELRVGSTHYDLEPAQYRGLAEAAAHTRGDAIDLEGEYRIYFIALDGGAELRVLSAETC